MPVSFRMYRLHAKAATMPRMRVLSLSRLPLLLLLAGILSACATKAVLDKPVAISASKMSPSALPTEGEEVRARKGHFFDTLRPLVRAENKRIREVRKSLLVLSRKMNRESNPYVSEEMDLIYPLAAKYQVPLGDNPDAAFWALLLKRVDEVPLELALAHPAQSSFDAAREPIVTAAFYGEISG